MSNKPGIAPVAHPQDFAEVLRHIQQTRQRVFVQANTSLIDLYWLIGQTLSHKVTQAGWGKGVVTELARYIAQTDPSIKGFSDKNLWRMKQFYEAYQGDEKLSALLRELPWSHNLSIFSRCKTAQERQFYLELAAKEKYSLRELDRQIGSSFFERTMAAPAKISTALREIHPAIGQAFKDHYVLEFLGLPEPYSENDLKRALVQNMKAFVLELGKDFLYVGEEHRLQVGNQDFFIDLLFYHRGLSALVAFELKVGQFKPEHMGQLNFLPGGARPRRKKTAREPQHRRSAVPRQRRRSSGIRPVAQSLARLGGAIPIATARQKTHRRQTAYAAGATQRDGR